MLPGLWDVHVHPDYVAETGPSAVEQTVLFGHALMQALTEAGVVAVRSAGAAHFIDVAWKRAFAAGQYIGPRVFAAGSLPHDHRRSLPHLRARARVRRPVRVRPGHPGTDQERGRSHQAQPDRRDHGPLVGPPLAVVPPRGRAGGGLRHLPAARLQGDGPCREPRGRQGRRPARRPQRRARLHHGYRVPRRAAGGADVVRADAGHQPSHARSGRDVWEKRWVEQRGPAPDLCRRAEAAADEHRKWFGQALAAGVKMALGSDIRPLKEAALLELGLWVKAGATPWQALLAATRNAAELCGVGISWARWSRASWPI